MTDGQFWPPNSSSFSFIPKKTIDFSTNATYCMVSTGTDTQSRVPVLRRYIGLLEGRVDGLVGVPGFGGRLPGGADGAPIEVQFPECGGHGGYGGGHDGENGGGHGGGYGGGYDNGQDGGYGGEHGDGCGDQHTGDHGASEGNDYGSENA